MLCMAECKGNKKKAIPLFKRQCKMNKYDYPAKPGKFLKKWYQRFKTEGSVKRHPSPGRKPKISMVEAKQAAQWFKEGCKIQPYKNPTGFQPKPVHVYHSSIEKAVLRDARLAALCEKYDISARTLFANILRADPNVVHRTIYHRLGFTKKQVKDRREQATRLFSLYCRHPTLLDRTIWVDCATIIVKHPHTAAHKVYCDAHDENVRAVITHTSVNKNEPVYTRFWCAVNAILGPVHIEFTTGTTDLQHSPEYLSKNSKHFYEVGLMNHVLP